MQQTLTDGNVISRTEEAKVYRDSKGRVRTERTLNTPSGQAETMVSIFDPVAGLIARLNAQNQTAVESSLPTPPTGAPPAPPAGASAPTVQTEDLGTKTISQLAATGSRQTITFAAGTFGNTQAIQVVRETWLSTDLSVPLLVTTSDPRRGTSTMQLTNISRGEQDNSLFIVPSTYSVTTEPLGPPPSGN